MRALVIEGDRVRYEADRPAVPPAEGEVPVRVLLAGVCATDLALARGYMGFAGIPGHEFVGVAQAGPLAGRRVVGEINAGCGECPTCRSGLARHCPRRSVLGILGRDGAFAEELCLPAANLLPVPDELSNEVAVFTEPVAAAFEIAEQLDLALFTRALVIGDGRLGLLVAQVLADQGLAVDLAGHHPERVAILPAGITHRGDLLTKPPPADAWELVVEASGNPDVLPRVLPFVRPRGTVVLKTTTEVKTVLDLSAFVVNEVRIVGSRCGPFAPALRALAEGRIAVGGMVDGRYSLEDGARAFEHAGRRGTLKILIDPHGTDDASPAPSARER